VVVFAEAVAELTCFKRLRYFQRDCSFQRGGYFQKDGFFQTVPVFSDQWQEVGNVTAKT
jgi:hypothetical protein